MPSTNDILKAIEGNATALSDLLSTKWMIEARIASAPMVKASAMQKRKIDLENGYNLIYDDIKQMLIRAGLSDKHQLDGIMTRISSLAYVHAKRKYDMKLGANVA